MINFKQFITEFDIATFISETKPFFNKFGPYMKQGSFLWHGTSREVSDKNNKFDFKLRTRPKDTQTYAHEALNSYFKKKFGHEFRNWLFAAKSSKLCQMYGSPYMIFPTGKVDWFFIDGIPDMTNFYDSIRWDVRDNMFDKGHVMSADDWDFLADEGNRQVIDALEYDKGRIAMLYNKGLDIFFNEQYEMMLKCDKFYLIRENSPAAIKIKDYIKSL